VPKVKLLLDDPLSPLELSSRFEPQAAMDSSSTAAPPTATIRPLFPTMMAPVDYSEVT
jgi:hypothetical protein